MRDRLRGILNVPGSPGGPGVVFCFSIAMSQTSLARPDSRTIAIALAVCAGLSAFTALAVFDPERQAFLHGIFLGRWGIFGNLTVLFGLAALGFAGAAAWARRDVVRGAGPYALIAPACPGVLALLTVTEMLGWTGIADALAFAGFGTLPEKPKLSEVGGILFPRVLGLLAVVYGGYALWVYRARWRPLAERWRKGPYFEAGAGYALLLAAAFALHVRGGADRIAALEPALVLSAALALLFLAVIACAEKPVLPKAGKRGQKKGRMSAADLAQRAAALRKAALAHPKLAALKAFFREER